MIGISEDRIMGAEMGSVQRNGPTADIMAVLVRGEIEDGVRYTTMTARFDCASRTGAILRVEAYAPNGRSLYGYDSSIRMADLGAQNSAVESMYNAACLGEWPFDEGNTPSARTFSDWAMSEIVESGVLAALNAKRPQE